MLVRHAWNYVKEHGFLAAYHRASWEDNHSVVFVPTLQQFSSGGLHMVGIDDEEPLQLVVRNMWRKF